MKLESSFDLDGDLIVVAATVVGARGRADVQLVLDTGAALTTVTPAIATAIGYSSDDRVRWSVTRTAAAAERGYIVRLAQLVTLGVAMADVAVNVADLGYGVDGVLGMSFLVDFNFEVRPAERRIAIEKIAR